MSSDSPTLFYPYEYKKTGSSSQLDNKLNLWEKFYKQILPIVLVLALPLIIGLGFRLYPILYYPQLMAKNTAELTVYSRLNKAIRGNIDKKFPDLSIPEKKQLESTLVKNALVKDKKNPSQHDS